MFGIDSFDPIINLPQIAILGVGRVNDEGSRRCTLSLSFDHRAVDGADAARFLDTLVDHVESPSPLIAPADAGSQPRESPSSAAHAIGEPSPVVGNDEGSVAELVGSDLRDRASEIAAVHGWSVPALEIDLDDGRPEISLRPTDDLSAANARRLTYAACRESIYANQITGLRDPSIVME